jgi:hypothetical protein
MSVIWTSAYFETDFVLAKDGSCSAFLCRKKVEKSEVYKAAEQKRFDLIQKSLEAAAASNAEVRTLVSLGLLLHWPSVIAAD